MKMLPRCGAKRLAIVGAVSLLLAAGCATRIPAEGGFKTRTLRAWYVAQPGSSERQPVPYEHVEFLPKKPTDRTFRIIGYVVPTKWKLGHDKTEGAIKAARAAGSLYGADAVYFVGREDAPHMPELTAAAIVWE